jgi:hypothetical protein
VRVTPTDIPDVLVIEPDVHRDGRGFFLETYHVAQARIEFRRQREEVALVRPDAVQHQQQRRLLPLRRWLARPVFQIHERLRRALLVV